MTVYRYRAVNKHGIVTSGHLSGGPRQEILSRFQEQGLDVLALRAQNSWFSFWRKDSQGLHQEFFMFCLYLEHFSQVGLPFVEGLHEMQKHFRGAFQGILEQISQDIAAGLLFSEALAKHPTLFDPVFISLVEVAEKTGDIATVFQKLTHYVKQNQETKTHLNHALRYPLLVSFTLLGAIVSLFIFLVPGLLAFLLTLETPLSGATRSLLVVSSFFPWGALWGGGGCLLSWVVFSTGMAHWPALRLEVHTHLLKIPVLGKLWSQAILSRIFYALSVMVGQGVDLLQGLAVAQRSIHQEKLLLDLRHVQEDVRSGLTLSQALARYPFFGGPFLRMIQIGEETGRLAETLQQISHLYRKESQERVNFLIALVEPVCLSILGLLLTWIIMATFMPLYDSLHFVEDA